MLVHCYALTMLHLYIILVGKHAGTLLHCYNVTLVYYTSREACWYIVTLLQCYTSIIYKYGSTSITVTDNAIKHKHTLQLTSIY